MDNIFICALEKGAETINQGISYDEIFDYVIKEKELTIPDNFEKQFRAWFFSSFYSFEVAGSYDWIFRRYCPPSLWEGKTICLPDLNGEPRGSHVLFILWDLQKE